MKAKKLSAFILAVMLVLSLGTTAFAAGSTEATVPVTLTVANEYRAVNVTVPASLPVYVINGTVVTADNAKITNNSKTGAIQVTDIKVTDGAYKVGSYSTGFRTNERATWNAMNIMRVLTNEIYIGTLSQHKRGTPNHKVKKEVDYDREDWIVVTENHEPIVNEIDFQTVQLLLQRDVRTAPGGDTVPLFSGFVFCGDCGRCMVRKTVPSGNKKYYYLVCSTNKARKGCSAHTFSEDKLTKIVFRLVSDHIQQICEVEKVLDYISAMPEQQRRIFNYDAQLTKLSEEIQRFQDLKLNLYSDMSDGVISKEEYLEFRSGYDRKIADKQKSIAGLREEREQAVDSNDRHIRWIELFKQYENITELERTVIVNLIERIVIYDTKHIEIVFRYQDQLNTALQYIERFSDAVPEEIQEGA